MSPLLNTLSKCHGVIHKYINAVIRKLRSAVEAKKSSYPLLICVVYIVLIPSVSHYLSLTGYDARLLCLVDVFT